MASPERRVEIWGGAPPVGKEEFRGINKIGGASDRKTRKNGKSKGTDGEQIDNTSANQHYKPDEYSCNLPPAQTGTTQRNVVYYQNRFIVLDTIPAKSISQTTNSEPTTDVQKSLLHTGCGTLRMSERNTSVAGDKSNERRARALVQADDSLPGRGKRGGLAMDASSVTMDPRAIEIVVSDESDSARMPSQTKHTLWKRITTVMMDNRMKGRQNLDVLNDHPEEYRFLKKVLNAVFVTIGVALFLSVFIVIIYTSVVEDNDDVDMRRGVDIANEHNQSAVTAVRQRRMTVQLAWNNH